MEHLIKTTAVGRNLKVIGTALYLDGVKEADALDPVILHPNKERILAAAPDATHMAGRVPLTRDQALAAQAALIAARARLAEERGCELITAQAETDGQSEHNMRRMGLARVHVRDVHRVDPA